MALYVTESHYSIACLPYLPSKLSKYILMYLTMKTSIVLSAIWGNLELLWAYPPIRMKHEQDVAQKTSFSLLSSPSKSGNDFLIRCNSVSHWDILQHVIEREKERDVLITGICFTLLMGELIFHVSIIHTLRYV